LQQVQNCYHGKIKKLTVPGRLILEWLSAKNHCFKNAIVTHDYQSSIYKHSHWKYGGGQNCG